MTNTKNSDSFCPEGYEPPKSGSNYMKLQPGENKIRILTNPVMGWEYWNADNKPVRSREFQREKVNPKIQNGKEVDSKHFWALVVYNYKDDSIQILQINQVTLQDAIFALSKDSDWGSPLDYDVKITRTGEELLTRYSINPSPKKPLDEEVKTAFKEMNINLDALFEGEDPFNGGGKKPEGFIESLDEKEEKKTKMSDLPF